MSQAVAISASDRIILVADDRAVDANTEEVSGVTKLFKLAPNCAAAITGMRLEEPGLFMLRAAEHISNQGLTDADQIAQTVDQLMLDRSWAENKDSYMYLLVAGYVDDSPLIRIITHKGLHPVPMGAHAIGDWSEAMNYLKTQLPVKSPSLVKFRDAEIAAIKLMSHAAKAEPATIGENVMMWHVFSDRIEVKSSNYVDRMKKKFGKS